MINYISGLAFVVLFLVGAALALLVELVSPTAAIALAAVWFVGDVVAASSIKLAAQWEQALVFRLGKYHSIRGPGLFLVIPLVDQVRMGMTFSSIIHRCRMAGSTTSRKDRRSNTRSSRAAAKRERGRVPRQWSRPDLDRAD